jgi:N6-L-threonylcarbamoyladenine synthase
VANAAKTGNPKAYRLPVPHVEGKYNVSFSGLKTAVLNEVNQAQMKGTEVNVPDLAASFQERIAGILAEKLLLAAADTGAKQVCLAGGVAANGRLRQLVNDGAQKLGAKVYLPELKFCGDNGAMIAAQGYYQYIAGHTAGLELNGLPTLPIDYE